ncbi:hypothetical protein PF010_g17023 [Phytophthora fragariae]|uniref:Uncharacterized protein n=1 Tax=Phytophthora fragariae TaxID=53985 RepID=A0A6A3EFM9_9STRA|nr:hypothetical protein PF009_g18872 [Phytophthora fragariae]KAE9094398.1 hypothetical protein PF007_g17773 [Phytophthora fragariae]KAE9094629.1 hypothetical protein PF010_g17023 [Phytophthora fragariae]KAE9127254.1 hypothetical protein PF006_g16548 [Phytophthora fragariae]KAE9208592.1 hypothetical protein PF004_g16721 [Phytophthora fragariae]
MVPSYFYLRPGAFDVISFAYGKVDETLTRGARVKPASYVVDAG